MIRFFLRITGASALSSIIGFPFIWRAVLVGWATTWAVLWTERECAHEEPAGAVRAGVFVVCGVLTGVSCGLVILVLELRCGLPGPEQFILSLAGGRYEPKLTEFLVVPFVTTLSVLGVGWCHLNRKSVRAWVVMFLALVVASMMRCIGMGSGGIAGLFVGTTEIFCIGAVPFALLWLEAARMAIRRGSPRRNAGEALDA